MSVIVYSKPACVQCNFTKKTLNKLEVPFEEVDITTNDDAFAKITGLGFQQVPVVDFNGETFSGYRPEKLEELARKGSLESAIA